MMFYTDQAASAMWGILPGVLLLCQCCTHPQGLTTLTLICHSRYCHPWGEVGLRATKHMAAIAQLQCVRVCALGPDTIPYLAG
jgi:hypothetical protein